ncbi:MAG: L-carnitine dehydratase/bile acid-inducible protein F, partial [uncultured Acetobacteraceae bacterium]
ASHQAPRRPARRLHGTGRGGALLRLPPRRRGRARGQDRALRGRLRPRLRRRCARPVQLLRVAEPRQGEHRPRHQEARRQGAARAHAGPRRRVHPKPRPRRHGPRGLRQRRAARAPPAPHHRGHLRLRRGGRVRRHEGLRFAGAGRERPRLRHRPPGGSGARRRVGLRHLLRHERPRRRAGSADTSRHHRPRQGHRGVPLRRHGGLDDGAAAPVRGHGEGAAAHRPRPPLHLPLRRLHGARRLAGAHLHPERARMGRLLRALPGRAGPAPARRLPREQRARRQSPGGGRAHRAHVRVPVARGVRGQARPLQHRLRLRQRLRGLARPPGAAARFGGHAGRAGGDRRPAGAALGRRAGTRPGAGARRARRRAAGRIRRL